MCRRLWTRTAGSSARARCRALARSTLSGSSGVRLKVVLVDRVPQDELQHRERVVHGRRGQRAPATSSCRAASPSRGASRRNVSTSRRVMAPSRRSPKTGRRWSRSGSPRTTRRSGPSSPCLAYTRHWGEQSTVGGSATVERRATMRRTVWRRPEADASPPRPLPRRRSAEEEFEILYEDQPTEQQVQREHQHIRRCVGLEANPDRIHP